MSTPAPRTESHPCRIPSEAPPCRWRATAVLLLAWLLSVPVVAQDSGATVAGRIVNPATGEYVADAEVRIEGHEATVLSQPGGSYRISGLPAGRMRLAVSYTGYETAYAAVELRRGETITQNIELRSLLAADSVGRPLKLDAFVVSSEPEGSAKALMSQRAAVEAKNVVAIDAYGDLPSRNVAELLKYTPGVEVDFSEDNAQSVRMGGMAPKYGGVMVDGMAVTNSIDSRQPQAGQLGTAGVSSIEVNKVGRPDLPGNAPAGSINLVSRSAFDRRGRLLTWQLMANANQYNLSLGKRPGLGADLKHMIGPGGSLEYAESFLGQRLGIAASATRTRRMNEHKSTTLTYNYAPTAASPEPAVVTTISYTDGPFEAIRSVGTLKVDFKIDEGVALSLAGQYSTTDIDFFNRTLNLVTTRPNLSPGSNLTTVIARQTANETTRIGMVNGLAERNLTNARLAPRLTFKKGNWDASLAGTYSSGKTDWGYGSDGQGNMNLTASASAYPLGWTAVRSNEGSTAWTFTQTSGGSIYDPKTWQTVFPSPNVSKTLNAIVKKEYNARADVTWTPDVKVPGFLKAGANLDQQDYRNSQLTYTYEYVGASGSRVQSPRPLSPVRYNPQVGGNMFGDGTLPVSDARLIALSPPSALIPSASNLTDLNNLFPDQIAKETVRAAYLMGGIRPGKLALEGGLRFESTHNEGKLFERLVAVVRRGQSDDRFRFLSGKYRVTRNLWFTSGYGESTLRPDLTNLTGRATINDSTMTGNIPNPSLQPEHANKRVARVEFYFEPAGTLSVGYFANNLKDRQVQTTQVPAENIGLGGTYPGYLFTTTVNRGDLKIDGFEVEYRQRFTFLPGLWKGLGAVASYTKNRFSDESLAASTSPALANGGLMYSHRRIIASLLSTWTDDTLVSGGAVVRYRKARTLLDANLSVRLFGEVRAFVNARNLTNAPIETYENVRTRIWKFQHFGTGYTFGLSGSF